MNYNCYIHTRRLKLNLEVEGEKVKGGPVKGMTLGKGRRTDVGMPLSRVFHELKERNLMLPLREPSSKTPKADHTRLCEYHQ